MASDTKNETKKKVEVKNNEEKVDESEMSKAEEEENSDCSSSSGDSEDLVNAINYNTITSLAALKDIIQGDNDNTPETDSFFQHYFMNHCNILSSRNTSSNSPFPFSERRRLSQCAEEDEDDDKKENDHHKKHITPKSTSGSESEATPATIDEVDEDEHENEEDDNLGASTKTDNSEEGSASIDSKKKKRMVMGARHKFLVTTAEPSPSPAVERVLRTHHNAHTVHFGTKGAEELRPNVRNIFDDQYLHRDKTYFDSSLIEIRSPVEEQAATLEDIWVKRDDPKPVLSPKEEIRPDGSSKPKVSVKSATLDERRISGAGRTRSGTWGSQTGALKKPGDTRRSSDDRRQKREVRLDAAITRSTQSVGERRRRGSADDGQPHPMYQQTIHGTTGVSRRPALFDIFKSRPRADAKKQPSIMQQVKAAVQSMTKSNSGRETPVKGELKPEVSSAGPATPVGAKTRDGSAHPHPGSDTRYYHTVTASASRRPSAMAKVMDIFRGRASVPGTTSPVDASKRKARAIQQHHNAGGKFFV
ncbi:hypothetical protein O0L34_g2755 [Tuta absoluta]|nr:hypothetical protein O0L34_g2755 [Tuta absoluta]